MMKQRIVLGLIIIAVLVLAACSKAENVAENAKDKVCEDLQKLEEPLDTLVELDAETTVQDVKDDVQLIDSALSALDSTDIDLGLGALDAVQEAWANLEAKVQGLEDTVIGDAAGDIQAAVAKLQDAFDAVIQKACTSD